MSAHIVEINNIHALMTALKISLDNPRDYSYVRVCGERYDTAIDEDIQKLGQILVDENHKSIKYRYAHNAEALADFGEAEPYTFKHYSQDIAGNPVIMLKIVEHYNYQACEHPDYDKSPAKSLVNNLQYTFINRLPGYDDAPWGIE